MDKRGKIFDRIAVLANISIPFNYYDSHCICRFLVAVTAFGQRSEDIGNAEFEWNERKTITTTTTICPKIGQDTYGKKHYWNYFIWIYPWIHSFPTASCWNAPTDISNRNDLGLSPRPGGRINVIALNWSTRLGSVWYQKCWVSPWVCQPVRHTRGDTTLLLSVFAWHTFERLTSVWRSPFSIF